MFILAGIMKSTQPKEKLAKMAWTTRYSSGIVKFIGISELLIGLGIILPRLTFTYALLTPIAALALCLIMLLASIDHYKNKEMKEIGINIFVLVMAGFVAYGRYVELGLITLQK